MKRRTNLEIAFDNLTDAFRERALRKGKGRDFDSLIDAVIPECRKKKITSLDRAEVVLVLEDKNMIHGTRWE